MYKADKDALKTADLDQSFDEAPPLAIDDLELTEQENTFLRKCLIHTALRCVVRCGGDRFQPFRKEVQASLPSTPTKIEVHQTTIHPLPAMNINESSTSGNAEVVDAMFKELGMDMSKPEFVEQVKLLAGDQLSIARLRAVAANRAGNEGGASALRWAVFMPGLFHYISKISLSI